MKLPVIVAQGEVSGAFPQPQASLALAGAPGQAVAQAGETITAQGVRTTQVYAEAQAKLRQADAKSEYEAAMNQLRQQFADRDIALKEGGVDPDAYVPELSKGLTDAGTQLATQMKYPEAQRAFMAGLQKFAAEKITAAKYDALKMRQGRIEIMDGVLQQEDANTAVFGKTAMERQEALARGLARPQDRLEKGIYDGAKAGAMTKAFMQDVDRGRIRRDARDPELRPQVIGMLLDAQYTSLDSQEQATLAKTMQDQSDAEAKRTWEATDKWWKEQQSMKVAELVSMAATKDLTPAALELARVEWRLTREDYNAIRSEMTKPLEEPASDTATLRQIDGDVHSQFPRATERSLTQLREAGKLNRKDYLSALDRLRETREGLLNRGESKQMQRHTQAEQEGMAELGIPLLFDRLEPNKEKARAAYLRELRQRSSAYNPAGEDAIAVRDEIIPRYKKMLDQDAQLTVEQTQRLLKYTAAQELEAAYRSGRITKGEYNAQRTLFLDLDTATQIRDANAAAAAERKKPGAKPAAGGGAMGRP